MALDLKVGIGVSNLKDSYRAGVAAVNQALANLPGRTPNVLIVFAAPRFNHAQLLKGITSVAKNVPLIGGTTAGEISPVGLTVNSVVVTALASHDITFTLGIGKNIGHNEESAGASLARAVLKGISRKEARTLIMLPDGLAGDGLDVVRGVQSVLGKDFEIVGGALGDEDRFKSTFQYINGTVHQDAVVGLLLSSKKPLITATGVRSGWESIGKVFKCTEATGNVVHKFNNRPALEFYEELLGPSRAKKLPAIGLEYPMGLVDESARIKGYEYFQIRCPLAVDKERGNVTFAAAIPQGKDVTLTYSSRESVVKGAKLAASQARLTLGKMNPRLILMFSCVARKMVLGRRTNDEIDQVTSLFGKNVPIAGFYTYGEIGPIDKRIPALKRTRWHNETVVLWVLGDSP